MGAGANVMSLRTYREVNPSEFDGEGNCFSGFKIDMTILKVYIGTTIKQHGVRGINCFQDGNPFRLIFHIVDIEGHTLLGLPTMRKKGLFIYHKLVNVETVDIHAEYRNLAWYESNNDRMSNNEINQSSSFSE